LKKFLVLLCVLVLVTGIAVAQVSVGVDFAIDNVTKADDGEWGPVLTPWIDFSTSLGDLGFYTYLDYNFDFTPDFKDLSQYANLYLRLRYNLGLGSASTLRFELDNRFLSFMISPREDEGNNVSGSLRPAIRFTQKTDIGSIYAQAQARISYLDAAGTTLRSRLGWSSTFGLALYGELKSNIDPTFDFYRGVDAYVEYGAGSFSSYVLAIIRKEISDGILIEPGFTLEFGDFAFTAYCDFDGIAAGSGSITIAPAVSISFSF